MQYPLHRVLEMFAFSSGELSGPVLGWRAVDESVRHLS